MTALETSFAVPQRIARLDMPERVPLIGQNLRQAERELEAHAGGLTGLVDLTYADTTRFPAPDWAITAFTAAATRGGLSYTAYRGDGPVRQVLAASLTQFLGFDVDPAANLILTPGTQAALFAVLSAIVENGDKVAMMDPDYLTNERLLRYLNADVTRVPMLWENDDAITIDFDALEAAFKAGAKVFVFSNPNNPTGTVHGPETVQRLAALALRHGVFVIADELYSRLIYDNRPFLHLAAVEGMRERTMTLLGPSKTESMSGYRLGAAVGPAAVIARMEDIQSVAALRAPAYAQRTMIHWLADDKELVADRVKQYQSLRNMVVRRFQQTEFLRTTVSGGTSYIFPRVVGVDASDQEIALRLQRDAGVIVNPGYQSGPGGIGHFRICFAQDEAVLARVLDRIVETIGALSIGK